MGPWSAVAVEVGGQAAARRRARSCGGTHQRTAALGPLLLLPSIAHPLLVASTATPMPFTLLVASTFFEDKRKCVVEATSLDELILQVATTLGCPAQGSPLGLSLLESDGTTTPLYDIKDVPPKVSESAARGQGKTTPNLCAVSILTWGVRSA